MIAFVLAIILLSGCSEPDPRNFAAYCADPNTIIEAGHDDGSQDSCICTGANQTVTPLVDFKYNNESKYKLIEGGYAVPYGTVMMITIDPFTVYGLGNYSDSLYPPIDVLINGTKVSDNGWYCDYGYATCYGQSQYTDYGVCGTQLPIGGNFQAYQFLYEGTFNVEVKYAPYTNASGSIDPVETNNSYVGWITASKFKVQTVYPALTAIGTPPVSPIGFTSAESTKTSSINWTIKNIGNTDVNLLTVAPTGCIGISCNLSNVPKNVGPNQSIVLTENLTLSKPNPSPKNYSLGLKIDYSDNYSFIKRTHSTETISSNAGISSALASMAKFNVELIPSGKTSTETRQCVGQNGELGTTGKGIAPKVSFTWKWADIELNACDKIEEKTDYIYCDPTQFSIELLKKLNQMDLYAKQQNTVAASSLQTFQAYLIGDNYNLDFRKDFDEYSKNANFSDTPSYYNGNTTPWDKYFTDETGTRFVLNNGKNPNETAITSGLYDVTIDLNFDSAKWQFFYNGTPTARISINLSKKSDAPQSPFYFLPFNGRIGIDSENGRLGYGLKFNGDSIPLAELGTAASTSSTTGLVPIATTFIQDFNKTNLENQGLVLTASSSDLKFSPSNATPIIMALNASNGIGQAHYFVRDSGQNVLGSEKQYLNLWTGIASTNIVENVCKDLAGNTMPTNRADSKAETSNCTEMQSNSFGFSWKGVLDNKLYLETVFYAPTNSGINLFKSCGDENSAFYSPAKPDGITAENHAIQLNYGATLNTVEAIFSQIDSEKICISYNGQNQKFWWNPQKVLEDLKPVTKSIESNGATICQAT